jgi:hypothetical protein
MIVKEKNYTDRQRTHVADFIGNSSLGIFQCLKIFFSGNANSKAHVFFTYKHGVEIWMLISFVTLI